jgi:hypothetical protein
MGALNKSIDAAGDSLKKVPIVGDALASGLGALVQPIRSFADVAEAFVTRGRELAQYSGPLSQAGAMADVRSIMADIREANELGPDIARLTDEQSKLWTDLRADFEPVKKIIIEYLVAGAPRSLQGLVRHLRRGGTGGGGSGLQAGHQTD